MKSKVTIIPEDSKVIVNGVPSGVDLSKFGIDADIHAIQWDGKSGRIERKKGESSFIKDFSEYAPIVKEHEAVLANIQKEIERQKAEEKEAGPTVTEASIAFKQRQKAKMLVAKARKAKAEGKLDEAVEILMEAVEPIEDAADHDALILAAMKKEKK